MLPDGPLDLETGGIVWRALGPGARARFGGRLGGSRAARMAESRQLRAAIRSWTLELETVGRGQVDVLVEQVALEAHQAARTA